jgi:hypothetical protein
MKTGPSSGAMRGLAVALAVLAVSLFANAGQIHVGARPPTGHGPGQGAAGALGNTDEAPIPAAKIEIDRNGEVYRLDSDVIAEGTAVAITADDVTLDLNGHTITYNASPSDRSVYGVYVAIGIDRVTIRNGSIVQGSGKSTDSPAVYLFGASWQAGPHELHDLVIRTNGTQSNGIQADQSYGFNGSRIYRNYIEVLGETDAIDGYGADCITVAAETRGGVEIFDNVLVGGHRGMQLIGLGAENANRSEIYRNRIQQRRRPGSKAPYGILLAGRSHNVHIHDNQIISDDGRGINIDGWGQGVPEGASGNAIFDNRIDVQYSSAATSGEYVENNVYGIRNRYSSGDNIFEKNTVLAASDIPGEVFGFYIGSDEPDPLMRNIIVRDNTIVARQGAARSNEPIAVQFGPSESIVLEANRFLAPAFTEGDRSVHDLRISDNVEIMPGRGAPAVPKGLTLRRFGDAMLLEWSANAEPDVLEYIVYRDGKRLPISPRGGTFYVDTGARGGHRYSVSAISLAGSEGPRTAEIPGDAAKSGWSD